MDLIQSDFTGVTFSQLNRDYRVTLIVRQLIVRQLVCVSQCLENSMGAGNLPDFVAVGVNK